MSHKKFALVFPPNFGRGVAARAFAQYCYDNGFRPEMITGGSAGSLAGASVAAWDSASMEKSWKAWSNLKPGQISKLKIADNALLASLGIGILLHLMPPMFTGKKAILERLAKAGFASAILATSFKAVLRQDALYDIEPLYHLLKDNIDFPKLFSSKVKLIVTSAGYQNGERIIHTNFLEEDRGDEEKFLHGLLESSGIVPLLQPDCYSGIPRVDAIFATKDFLAIDLIEEYCPDCEKIFVCVFYWLPKVGDPKHWPESGEHTGELLVRDKIEAIIASLPPQTRKKVVLVESEYKLPKLQLRSFDHEDLRDYLAMGYRAAEKAFKSTKW